MEQTRKVALNVVCDLIFDGNDVSVYLDGLDITSQIKRSIGPKEFADLEDYFKQVQRDPYREWVDGL